MTKTDPMIGEQLGDYKIISVLGKGGMARVYRGFDPKLERFAAVKVIDKGLAQPEYRDRFQREARAIAKLQHPRIVHVYQFGETEEYFYMAMVFVDGRDLAHLIREARAMDQLLPLTRAMRIISDVAEALDYAHSQGVIHRDVKPSNVMVTPEGRAVLTDFGLALSVTEGTIGSTFGTAHYIAPEQAVSSANAVPQSDQYSLGVVAYQLLTGRVPFDDPGITNIVLKHLNQTPAQPSSVNPKLPAAMDAALMRSLEKTPEARYLDCRGLVRAMEKVLEEIERRQAEAAFAEDWGMPAPIPPGQHIDTDIDRPTTLSMPSTGLPATAEAATGRAAIDLDAADVLPMDDTPLMTPIPPSVAAPANKGASENLASPKPTRATGESRAIKRSTAEIASESPSQAARTPSMRRTTGSFARVVPDTPAERPPSLPRPPSRIESDIETEPQRRISPVLLIALGIVAVVIIGAVILLSSRGGGDPATTPTSLAAAISETPESGIGGVVDGTSRPPTFTPTPSADAVIAGNPEASEEATEAVTEDAEPTATNTPRTRVPTRVDLAGVSDEPTHTREVTPTRTRPTRTNIVRSTATTARTSAPTATPVIRDENPTPTDTATNRPTTAAPTTQVPTATDTATEVVVPTIDPTSTARANSTVEPVTDTIDEAVILIYNADSFALYNRTGAQVNVSQWYFVQPDVRIAGEMVSYQASQWAGTGANLNTLETTECLQLWRITLGSELPPPEDCLRLAAWRSVGQRRWFWISETAESTFEVRLGQGFTAPLLATCPTAREGDDETLITCAVSPQS